MITWNVIVTVATWCQALLWAGIMAAAWAGSAPMTEGLAVASMMAAGASAVMALPLLGPLAQSHPSPEGTLYHRARRHVVLASTASATALGLFMVDVIDHPGSLILLVVAFCAIALVLARSPLSTGAFLLSDGLIFTALLSLILTPLGEASLIAAAQVIEGPVQAEQLRLTSDSTHPLISAGGDSLGLSRENLQYLSYVHSSDGRLIFFRRGLFRPGSVGGRTRPVLGDSDAVVSWISRYESRLASAERSRFQAAVSRAREKRARDSVADVAAAIRRGAAAAADSARRLRTVTLSDVPLRTRPSFDAPVVAQCREGDTVFVIGNAVWLPRNPNELLITKPATLRSTHGIRLLTVGEAVVLSAREPQGNLIVSFGTPPHEIVGRLDPSSAAEIVASQNDSWVRVSLHNYSGWILARFLASRALSDDQ